MLTAKQLIIPLVCASALLHGCSFLKETIGLGPRRPNVQVYTIEVKKVSLLALEMQVTVQVDNPNDFALNLSRLRYNLVAAGLPVAEGRHEPMVSVPASGKSLVKLPLSVNATNVVKLVQMIVDGTTDPEAFLTATADFETPFGPIEVDFEDRRPLRKMAGMKH
jgi:LEA14-like dessication related protein